MSYCRWLSNDCIPDDASDDNNDADFDNDDSENEDSPDNNKQIFHAFLFNIRNYSPEVSDIQRREAELNIILQRVNNFDIKQKSAWNICFIIYPQHQTKSWVNANKAK